MLKHKYITQILLTVFLLITQLSNGQYINQRYSFTGASAQTALNAIENDIGYIMIGGTSLGYSEIGITQTDFSGNILFQKTYAGTNFSYYAGFQNSLTKLTNGGYAMYGGVATSVGAEAVGVLFRFDENGDTLWTKTYGDSLFYQTGRHMRQTLDGGFILLGHNGTSAASNWIVKTDSLGGVEWEQTYGGPNYEGPAHIAVCNDGGYIFSGNTASLGPIQAPVPYKVNIRIMKVDSLGNEEFTKVFGELGDDAPWGIEPTQDGGYIFGGSLKSDADGHTRFYAVRLDSVGDTIWTKTFNPFTGITLFGIFNSIQELPDGSFIGGGFEWHTDSTTVAYFSGSIIKMDANGNELWHKTYRISGMDAHSTDFEIKDMRPTSDGGFICSGFVAPALPDTGTQDMWLLKIDSNGCADTACSLITGIPSTQHSQLNTNSLAVYPNPTNGIITIELPKNSTSGSFRLINVRGKEVLDKIINSSTNQIDVSHISKGIYFYRYRDKKQGYAGKLVVQ